MASEKLYRNTLKLMINMDCVNCRSNLMSDLRLIALRGWTYVLVLTNFVIKFSILVTNELEKTVIMSNDEDLGLISSKKKLDSFV